MCVCLCECVLSKKSAGHISWSSLIMQIMHPHWWEVSSTQEFGATTFVFEMRSAFTYCLVPDDLFIWGLCDGLPPIGGLEGSTTNDE